MLHLSHGCFRLIHSQGFDHRTLVVSLQVRVRNGGRIEISQRCVIGGIDLDPSLVEPVWYVLVQRRVDVLRILGFIIMRFNSQAT